MAEPFRMNKTNALPVAPVSLASEWMPMFSGSITADSASGDITNPNGGNEGSPIVRSRDGRAGTFLRLRLKYRASMTGPFQSPTVQVFGRTGGDWQRLFNKSGEKEISFTPELLDVTDGTWSWTDSGDDQTVDLDGNEEVKCILTTEFDGTGTSTGSTIEGKMI